MKLSILALASVLMTLVSASSSLESSGLISKRASFPVPASKGKVTFKAPQVIAKGKTYDGGLKTYGRGVKCGGQSEGGDKDAVFQLEDGATLKNAIIGVDQIEGVHCMGSCTIENVWWTDVCEDALTIKGDGNAFVYGGGAQHAEDKVVQHNGQGTVTIDGFTVSDFGKLYRSCGNCKPKNGVTKPKRTVVIKNVKADSGKVLVGINSNFGDTATATVTGTCATSVKTICQEFEGNTNQKEPPKIGKGEPSKACKFTAPLPKC